MGLTTEAAIASGAVIALVGKKSKNGVESAVFQTSSNLLDYTRPNSTQPTLPVLSSLLWPYSPASAENPFQGV